MSIIITRHRTNYLNRQNGGALLAALIILTVIAFTGVTVARMTTATQQDSTLYSDKTASRLNAETPVNLVLGALRQEANQAAAVLVNEANADNVQTPISTNQFVNDRWWYTENNWANNANQLTNFPGRPEFVIENVGSDRSLQSSDRPTNITTFYRLTSRASGDLAQNVNQNANQAQSVIQTYIGIVE